ncbi:MAG: hypothetical protein KDJ31_14935 [Candidatus Competibacteraceae bacterium]|nr:hypothetical protein [Candidatus Competibacteraceae bacterium]MCB1820356.1 hypothetical protein [Candidatus Competibacteraceae bacterium]
MNIPSRLELIHNDLMDASEELERLRPAHPVAQCALVKVQRHLVSAMMDLHRAQIAEELAHVPAATPD